MAENRNENRKENNTEILTGIKRALPILFTALSVFLAVCYMTKNVGGFLGAVLSSFMLGLFSYGAYAIPLLLLLHAIFFRDDLKERRILSRAIFSVVTVLLISVLDYAIAFWWQEPPFIPTELYSSASGGGFIGSMLAFLLIKAIGHVGLIILLVATLITYVTFFFARSDSPARRLMFSLLGALADAAAYIERRVKQASRKNAEAKKQDSDERVEELANDDFFAVDNGMAELSVRELGIKETRNERDSESAPHLHDSVHHKSESREATGEERRRPDFSYAETVYEEKADALKETAETPVKAVPELTAPKSAEASAEDVFTKEFDPYNFATAEAEIAKQNSLRQKTDAQAGVSGYEKPLSSITHEDAERLRREAEFEARKRELVERAKQEAEARHEAEMIINRSAAPKAIETTNVAATEPEPVLNKTEISCETPVAETAPAATAETPESIPSPIAAESEAKPIANDFEIVSYEPESAEAPDNKKTVEFSFGDGAATPTETDGVSITFDKFEDDTEEAAAAVADRILAANPAYARSMNPMSTRTTVHEDTAPEPIDVEGERYELSDEDIVTSELVTETTPAYESVVDFKPYETECEETTVETASDELLFTERSMINPEPLFEEDESEEDESSFAEEEAMPTDDRDEIFGGAEEEESEDEPTPIPPEEQNPDVIKMREQFPFLFGAETKDDEDAAEETGIEASVEEIVTEPISNAFETVEPEINEYEIIEEAVEVADTEDDIEDEPEPITVPEPMPLPVKEKVEKPKPKRPDYSNYQYPPIDLLTVSEDVADEHIQEEIQENADRLIDTLASFNVTASIKGYDRGPRITRYEIVPAKGVKVSSVMSLQDDIALNLAAESIRMEAPIPGKSAVGVEIPNKKSSTVRLRELLETEDFTSSKSKTTVCMGKDVAGLPVIADIAKMPHALIAGATGMGKSVCINSLMISMLYKARPDEVKFIMIDPKQVEFTMYNGIPHLLVPIVNDVKQAAGTLMWAVEEMERRYNMLQEACVRNIDGYNEKVAAGLIEAEPLHRIVIVIDEFAELIMQVKNPVESLVIRIAQKARAAGIHLIIGTQKPVKEVITGLIKSNIPTKMSCKVLSNRDSILIFDQSGAEKLLDKGDMLISFAASPKPQRVQCAFVSDGEVEAVMEYLKQFSSGEGYDETVMEDIRRAADKCTRKGGGDSDDDDGDESGGEGYLNDKQFLDAVEVALNMGKISTSLIQRKISVGYGKAAKFIDVMEDMGIVSEPNGQKPRDVLMTKDEWREKLARVTYD